MQTQRDQSRHRMLTSLQSVEVHVHALGEAKKVKDHSSMIREKKEKVIFYIRNTLEDESKGAATPQGAVKFPHGVPDTRTMAL